jgi:hypothetical protein
MKSRSGFVSNSSSTAFILDKRLPSIERWFWANKNCIPFPHGAGRITCLAVGQDAVDYANFLNEYDKEWGGSDLGAWILEWAEKIGVENVVFARESDEGMGGYLGDDFPSHKALAEMEYH